MNEVVTSRRCTGGSCVGVARTHRGVQVSDTKTPGGQVLNLDGREWAAFVTAVKTGLPGVGL